MDEQAQTFVVSDAELVGFARAGSAPALDQLLRRYQRRLFLFIRRRVYCDQDAEDVLQETLMKAMRYLDRFDNRYRFSTWIYTIANQLVIGLHRKKKHAPLPADLPAPANDPQAAAESASIREKIWRAVETLPRKQADVVWLRYVEDLPINEVAKALSLSGINTRVLLHRARLALAKVCGDLAMGEGNNPSGAMTGAVIVE